MNKISVKSEIPFTKPVTDNLIVIIKNGLEKNAHQTLFIDYQTGNKWTCDQVKNSILKIVKYLHDNGLKKGDACILHSPEDGRLAVLILAVISAGGCVTVYNENISPEETVRAAKDCRSKFFISCSSFLKQLPTLDGLNTEFKVISIGKIYAEHDCFIEDITDLLDQEDARKPEWDFDYILEKVIIDGSQDVACLQYSGGTTGSPKIIPRTHRNLSQEVECTEHEELLAMKPTDVIAGNLVLTHGPGQWAALACLRAGSALICGFKMNDVEETIKKLSEYRVSVFWPAIPMLNMLATQGLELKDRYDLCCLREINTTGAKLVHDQQAKVLETTFDLEAFRQTFGITECGRAFIIERSDAKDNYLSIGRVVPGMEASVLRPNSDDQLTAGEMGEIALRGPQVFPGYLAQGKLNKTNFTPAGWFRTGDKGYFDKNNLFYLCGRFKELMIFPSDGRFFPENIETMISEHPAVAGVCAVNLGQFLVEGGSYDRARAYVILKTGCEVTEEELIKSCVSRCKELMLEGGIRFIDKFPRLPSGKVDKLALKNLP